MRKRTVSKFFDSLIWFIIYALPFLITFTTIIANSYINYGNSSFTFDFLVILENNLNALNVNNSLVYTTLIDLFGSSSSIMPLFNSNLLLLYFAYFINCIIVHVAVDILALLPRVAHKLLDKVVK